MRKNISRRRTVGDTTLKLSSAFSPAPKGFRSPPKFIRGKIFRSKFPTSLLNFSKKGPLPPKSCFTIWSDVDTIRSDAVISHTVWLPVWLNSNAISAWMGDRLRTGKRPRCTTRHPGLLSLSHPCVGRQTECPTKTGGVNSHIA